MGKEGKELAVLREAKDLAAQITSVFSLENAERVQWMGMTDYQLRHFTLSRRDYPTDDARYRQCVRELWAHYQALKTSVFEIGRLAIACDRARAQDADLAGWRGWRYSRARRAVERAALAMEIRHNELAMEDVALELRVRVIRSTRVLMEELAKVAPAEGERDRVEYDNWQARVQANPREEMKVLQQFVAAPPSNGHQPPLDRDAVAKALQL